jgi:hypothetical protein
VQWTAVFDSTHDALLQVQCTGVVPTVAIDKVDGCQVSSNATPWSLSLLAAAACACRMGCAGQDYSPAGGQPAQ